MTIRVACWSGPRNLSTALMRAFENRADTAVTDEPLYAHYLAHTGFDHPMRNEVLASQSTDWRQVVRDLTGPCTSPIWYQKHMSHHLLPNIDRSWLGQMRNVLLIRDPDAVALSYYKARGQLTLNDLGYPQQAQIFTELSAGGTKPIVIDRSRILGDPEGQLSMLCDLLGIEFDESMLSWPAGPRDSDGVWAPHWYETVWASTGFAAPNGRREMSLPDAIRPAVDAAMPLYEHLLGHAV